MRLIINKVIRLLGRENYSIDKSINDSHLIKILLNKFIQFLKGTFYRSFFKKSTGFLFLGKNTSIKYKSKISLGRTITIGNNVKINALSKRGIKIGNNFTIKDNSIIDCCGVFSNLGEKLTIGNNVGISENCFIQVRGEVVLGNNIIIGPGSKIFSENHRYDDDDKFINEQGVTRVGVKIADGVWIGGGVTILDGVKIGKKSIIAAGSVVNKSVEEYSIYGGVPAKKIKNLKEQKLK